MSRDQAAVLAIDGGNSKTDIALVAADGTLLASGRGPGVRTFPTPEVLASIGAVIGTAALEAGLPGGWPVAAHTVACMANADLPEEEERLAGLITAAGWSTTTEVANDTFAVLRAGLDTPRGRPWGVAVTCGAGINCVAVAPSGAVARYLALGTLTGDWGGGMGLAQAVMWHAMRGWDGRGPATALGAAAADHFGLPSIRDVAVAVHKRDLGEADLHRLTSVLFTVAAHGDQVARSLVDRQAAEICVMAAAAMRQLEMAPAGVPVVLGGGLLEARDKLLTTAVEERLATAAPGVLPRVVDIPPIAGAALLGLDYLGADADAARRLRQCYLTPGSLGASTSPAGA